MTTTTTTFTEQRSATVTRRAALIALGGTVLMYAAGVGFMIEMAGDPTPDEHGLWAPLSDAGSLLFAVTMFPVARTLGRGLTTSRPSRAVRHLGVAALGLIAGGAAWLLINDASWISWVGWLGLGAQLLGFAVFGAWLALVGRRSLVDRFGTRTMGVAALVGGAGYLLGTVFSVLQLWESPLMAASYLAALGGVVVWLVSLARNAD